MPSRALNFALTAISMGAGAALFYADLPVLVRIAAAALALSYAAYCRHLQARQRGRLQWRETWLWQPQEGVERMLQLRSATLWPGLIVLVFRDAATRRALTFALWRDSLHADDGRRLRVSLRHAPVFGAAFDSPYDT
jgi:hypothetical protein